MNTTVSHASHLSDQALMVQLLVAQQGADAGSELIERATSEVGSLIVIPAPDSADAIRLGLHYSPALGLIDLGLLGAFGVARTLRELRPAMRLALHGCDADGHRDAAHMLGVPFFDSCGHEDLINWVASERAALWAKGASPTSWPGGSYVCAECGYGVARATPPDRCAMCQAGRWRLEP